MAETENILREMQAETEEALNPPKKKRGRPKGSGKKTEPAPPPPPPPTTKTKKKSSPLPPTFQPLSENEKENLKAAIGLAHSLVDDGLWHAGLETDPELGGMPIWALDMDELETVADFYFKMAEKRPQLNHAARMVIKVYEGWQVGAIYATRVGLTVYAFMTYGVNLRFSKKPYQQQAKREGTDG